MITHTDIVNIALAKLDVEPIVNISPPASGEEDKRSSIEKQIARIYNLQRRIVLSRCTWSFARKQLAFSSLKQIKGSDGRTYYERPSDFITNRDPQPTAVLGTLDNVQGYFYYFDFRNITNPYWSYIFDNFETDFYTPIFIDALSTLLAAELAVVIPKKIELQQLYEANYERKLAMALAENTWEMPFQISSGLAYNVFGPS